MFHGWWIVATVFLVQLFMVGFMSYGYPLVVVPVEAEFQAGMETMSYAPMGMTLLGLVLPLGVGPLVDRWSVRGLLAIGIGCLTTGLLALAWSPNVMAFIVVMSTLIAVANTLLGPIVGSAAVSRWFTASRGLALGIAAMGTSIGGIVMAPMLGMGFESIGWRASLRVLALVVALIGAPLLLLVFRSHPRELGLEPEGGASSSGVIPAHPVESKLILRQPRFWAVSVCLAFFLGSYTGMLVNLGRFAADLGADGSQQARMIMALSLAGLIGKLIFGWIADRIPLKLGLWIAIGLTTAAVTLMTTEPEYPLLLVSAAVMGLAAGGILPVWGALMAAIFGVANFGRAMGLQAPLISVAALAGYAIAGRSHGLTGSFVLAFQIFAGVLCVAFLVLFALRMPAREGEPGGARTEPARA